MKNSEYFNSKQLMDRWKIQKFDLLEIVKQKNLPYKTIDPLGFFAFAEAGNV